MDNVVATFTAVYPPFAAVTNDIGYAYEITLINQGESDIPVDTFTIDINFGSFGHPAQNSIFLYSINAGAAVNAFALAVPYNQPHFTTRVRIGFMPNVREQAKSLLAGQNLVLRMLTPAEYDDYSEPIENSITVTSI